MQLDRTEIVIRARSAAELLDLSLLVLKRHAWAIAVTSGLLGLPLLILDTWVVAWMLSEDTLLVAERVEYPLSAMRWRHSTHLILLYVTQFPIISLPTTLYLGNRIFFEPMPLRKLIARLKPIAGRCLLLLGVIRLGLVGLALHLCVRRDTVFDWPVEFWLIFTSAAVALLLRAIGPFAPEILGLELCPLRKRHADDISYATRSRGLHRLMASDHVARFLGAAFFGSLLFLMLIGLQLFVRGVSTGYFQWNAWFDHLALPLTMWLVGLFMAVFRFLSYLDSRIRLEGWEIELRLKAEALRLNDQVKVGVGDSTAGKLTAAGESRVAGRLPAARTRWWSDDQRAEAASPEDSTALVQEVESGK